MPEAAPRPRWHLLPRPHPHRYLKYAFLDDLDSVRHIQIGRLWGVRLAVTPTVWIQVPFFFVIGAALTFLPGRLPIGTGIGERIGNAMIFTVAGLIANTVHSLGHVVSGTLAGSAMDKLLITATRDSNIYEGDQSAVRGRTHIARAIGGPVANLLAAGFTYLILSLVGGGPHALLTRIAGVNLGFGLGAFLPLPSVDGEVIWREVWRGVRGSLRRGASH